jgi:hypothetical protein
MAREAIRRSSLDLGNNPRHFVASDPPAATCPTAGDGLFTRFAPNRPLQVDRADEIDASAAAKHSPCEAARIAGANAQRKAARESGTNEIRPNYAPDQASEQEGRTINCSPRTTAI